MLNILIALRKKPSEEILALLKGHKIDVLKHGESPVEAVVKTHYDALILEDTIAVLKSVKNADPRVEVILIAEEGADTVAALREGAGAVFARDFAPVELKETINGIVEVKILKKETAELEESLSSKYTFQGVIGRNPHMLEIFNFIRRVAPYYKTITVIGETGTGKEVIARALHNVSPASGHPFIVFNCGGVVENLVESELFGHKKGAFTGAVSDKPGLFEAAGEGTIFLDEIGELPLSVQPHLLRVLQDGEARRLGSNQPYRARCRVIAATNRDLSEDVRGGRFRDDLFFRLTPLTIPIPPLRERKGDVLLLMRHLIKKFSRRTGKNIAGVSRAAQVALLSYDWPGNVRELENVLERAAILAKETFVSVDDLPSHIKEKKAGEAAAVIIAINTPLDELIKGHIGAVLQKCSGNRTKAAKVLGISRRALLRKMEKYSIK